MTFTFGGFRERTRKPAKLGHLITGNRSFKVKCYNKQLSLSQVSNQTNSGSAWNRHPAADAATNYTLERGKKDSETQLPMYLRLYMPSQPDLNWENTRVRNAIWDVMKFWLDRGVNGFRVCLEQIRWNLTHGVADHPWFLDGCDHLDFQASRPPRCAD
jgi:hypothetical protein